MVELQRKLAFISMWAYNKWWVRYYCSAAAAELELARLPRGLVNPINLIATGSDGRQLTMGPSGKPPLCLLSRNVFALNIYISSRQ